MKHSRFSLLAISSLLFWAVPAMTGVNVTINNVDPPGQGLNDPTPATPVGGNPGTTIGQQRLIAMQFAADVWGNVLQSDVDIVVQATFRPLGCSPTGAQLGAAAALQIFANFPPGPPDILLFHWYHAALANKIAGFDLTPGPPDPGFLLPPFNDDIFAIFNSLIDNNPGCLPGNWYYGLDHNPPPGDIDFLNVILHEMGHGLGFSNFIDDVTGAGPLGLPDIYTVFQLDNTTGKHWNIMTDAERAASEVNTGNVVWDGPAVTAKAPDFLDRRAILTITAPAGIAGDYTIQEAFFGPAIDFAGLSGDVVLADDGVLVTGDGCEAFTNAAAIDGNIALVDRGGCTFTVKVANAQAAGAVAVLVANNVAAGLPPMGGTDPTITIPSAGISQADGNAIKANLPGVAATLVRSPTLLIGADDNGFVRLYAPNPVQPGSSISHWDTVATPNLLMEPFLSSDLEASVDQDLTPYHFLDIGWGLMDSDGDGIPEIEDSCPTSDTSATVVIDGCDSGVPNTLFADGCTISDLIAECAAGAGNHGGFVSCVAHLTNDLKQDGIISGKQKGKIQSCAAQANIP